MNLFKSFYQEKKAKEPEEAKNLVMSSLSVDPGFALPVDETKIEEPFRVDEKETIP